MKKQVLFAAQLIVLFTLLAALSLEFNYWQYTQQLPGPYEREGGDLWVSGKISVPLPGVFESHDDDSGLTSSLKLFESGRESGPAHALLDDIRNQGAGRYAHLGRRVFFSTNGTADPNNHSRDFSVSYPVQAKPASIIVLLLIWLLLVLASSRVIPLKLFDPEVLHRLIAGHRLPVVLVVVISLGTLLRIFWTWTLKVPYLEPDSADYLQQAMANPLFPISEVRTVGSPCLIAAALMLFQHPIGILIVNNLLWLFSTLMIVWALIGHAFLRLCALPTAVYLSFVQKNLAFEYFLLSEHVARVFYVVYFAIIIGCVRKAWQPWVVLALSLVVVFNVLVKPSALVLIPVTLLYFPMVAVWLSPARRRQLGAAAVMFLSITGSCLFGYGYLFHKQYGPYEFTNFTGWNLYSHVGQFTVLDDGIYPELKQELRRVLPLYNEKYVSEGNHQPDWLVYGSSKRRLSDDFGGESPASIIQHYVESNKAEGSQSNVARMNEIYLALAEEAIKAHPGKYFWYALIQTAGLFPHSGGLFYSDNLTPGSYANHGAEMNRWRVLLHRHLPEGTTRDYFPTLRTALDETRELSFGNDGWVHALYRLFYFAILAVNCILAIMIIGAMLMGAINLFSWSTISWRQYSPEGRIFVLVGLAIVASYAVFLGLVNTSAPARFATNVQDVFVITMFMLAANSRLFFRTFGRAV